MKQLGIFLKRKHVNKGETPTHVRIANKSLNIPGGAYNIDYSNETEFNEFVESYVNTVIKKNRNEYLTEVQDRKNGGPILVDLDFKMPKDNTERLFDKEIIDDIVQTYAETINEKFDLSKIEEYSIFVLLKDDINEENTEYNKDGIHIQFSFGAKHREQMYLRSIVMKKVENEVFTSMDFENNIDDIFDKSISSGSTGWLIYGSCKPGGEPYKLKYKYNVKIFEDDYELNDCSIKKIRSKEIFKELLIRKKNIDMITLKDEYKSELDKFTNNGYKKTSDKIVIKNTVISSCFIKSSFKNIYSEEICDNMIQLILENSIINNSKIKEINRYLMKCLDERYYEPYADWIRVLWACKNTDEQLYPFFLKWSSQSEKFSWNDTENIDYIYNLWEKSRNTGLKEASIRYWAIKCNSEQYDKIRNESIDKYVIKTLEGNGTDHDIAKLIHFMMYDKYRCTSIKTNTWFSFDNHKWSTCECGTKLRRTFSSIISPLYLQKQKQILGRIRVENDMTTETQNLLASQAAVYNKISIRLRETSKKNNIMQESKELHYDSQLESKLNENPNLLCFNNGVYDFDQGCFRDGIPEDYISKCTNIDYVEIDDTNEEQKEIINEIKDFMKKLFPNENLRKYMWQHLASCLLGSNSNQTFNIYTGVGSNGKSVLVQIMALILGDYKGTVPISLITQKRLGIGGTSSEVAQLKGLRYAVMNEPSKGDVINEGIMKEITGGDPIQARELYKQSITFVPQFKLACCTNTLFDIKSNDEGTWRRIRVVDFMAKFVDNPSKNPEDFEFKKDKSLSKRFPVWAPVFASMLIEILKETKGNVEDCEEVLMASRAYRENQDCLAKFVAEKIKKFEFDPNVPERKSSKISITNAKNEFKAWWSREYDTKPPKAQELVDYLNKTLGEYKNRGWRGYEIIYDDCFDEDDD